MRAIESHSARIGSSAGRVSPLLCALLCVAPCSATDGRWFLNPLPTAAPPSEVASVRAPEMPDARQDPFVVLAPGVVSQTISRPKPPQLRTVERVDALAVRTTQVASRPAPPDGPSRPLRETSGRDTHLRVCVLLI